MKTTLQYKHPVLVPSIVPIKEMKRATGAIYNSRTVKNSSHLLTLALYKYKDLTTIALLLIIQFALYDFDIKEYTSNNPHGATAKLIQTA